MLVSKSTDDPANTGEAREESPRASRTLNKKKNKVGWHRDKDRPCKFINLTGKFGEAIFVSPENI